MDPEKNNSGGNLEPQASVGQNLVVTPQGRCSLNIRTYFAKLVKYGNELPRNMISVPNQSVFKRHMDNALNNML